MSEIIKIESELNVVELESAKASEEELKQEDNPELLKKLLEDVSNVNT